MIHLRSTLFCCERIWKGAKRFHKEFAESTRMCMNELYAEESMMRVSCCFASFRFVYETFSWVFICVFFLSFFFSYFCFSFIKYLVFFQWLTLLILFVYVIKCRCCCCCCCFVFFFSFFFFWIIYTVNVNSGLWQWLTNHWFSICLDIVVSGVLKRNVYDVAR